LSDDVERGARVEQLLLSGLDQYFAGQYEEAINIWTRVPFLERDHGRARAYIKRARQALAERQRESEEALERGIEAYHAGNMDAARALLKQAGNDGGAGDRALVFLERLDRLEELGAPDSLVLSPTEKRSRMGMSTPSSRSWLIPAGILLVCAAVFGVVVLVTGWWNPNDSLAERTTVTIPVGDPLPIAQVSERLLDVAASFYANGDLRAALDVLSQIDVADRLRPDADRLVAVIQQALLVDVASPFVSSGAEP
jgi:hypothetical protein